MWEKKESPAKSARSDDHSSGDNTAAQFGKSLRLKGEISGSEHLSVDGQIEGKVTLNGHDLTVGPNATVHADVTARSITILGRLKGSLRAEDRIEIRKTGSVEGDVVTANIAIEEGAEFRGSVDIVKPEEEQKGSNLAKKPPAGLAGDPPEKTGAA